MTLRIVNDEERPAESGRDLLNRLIGSNLPVIGAPDYRPVVLLAKREEDLVGGLSGYSLYGWLHVEVVWVEEAERRRGIGRGLMTQAEEVARQRNCAGIYLDTFDFQAPGFYERLGYRCFAQLPNWAHGHDRLSYRKFLS